MSMGPLHVLLGEVSILVLCPFLIGLFVFLEWSHVSSLYILENKLLSEVSLANMFSHIGGPLHFTPVFFRHAERFNMMKSHFSFFPLCPLL